MPHVARHIAQTITRDPATVIAFAGKYENLPSWAAGLSSGIHPRDGRWVADTPSGEIEVCFVGVIALGILDHEVTLPDGSVILSPLRVIPNDDGSEVVFTLYRLPGVSDEDFNIDAALIAEDLERLRVILEADSE